MIIAMPIWIIAVYSAYQGLRLVFASENNEMNLIKTNIFKRTRHPAYLGSLLIYFGLCISTLSLISFALLIPIFLIYNRFVDYEEKQLIKQFDDEYIAFMRITPKWRIKFRIK
ncbi:MAG: DUF1295 domain-containing protein [Candidatus Lokiarchaeota archaeon]|nr:DUF1295 domain-containing protein [Candidatus Lokiarchaeota archaeon]